MQAHACFLAVFWIVILVVFLTVLIADVICYHRLLPGTHLCPCSSCRTKLHSLASSVPSESAVNTGHLLQMLFCVSPGFGRAALDFGLAAGLSVSGLYGPLKQWRERQLSSIFASGQTLRLQFPKEDLGFVYNTPGAAVCPETGTALSASAQPQPDSAGADATAVNTKDRVHTATRGSVGGSDRRYRPSCTPGSRLPHCTLHQLNTGSLPCPRVGQSRFCSVLPCCRLVSCAVPFMLKMWLASAAASCSMSVLLLCCLACLESTFFCLPSVLMSSITSSCLLTFFKAGLLCMTCTL